MTTAEALRAAEAIHRLRDRRLPARVAYALVRSSRALDAVVQDYQAARAAVLLEHGEPDDAGCVRVEGGVPVLRDAAAAEAALQEVLSEEVSVATHTVELSALGDEALEPSVLHALLDVVLTTPEDDAASS